MGCFNMNCALSKLPITNQDEVIMIPMINQFQKSTREVKLPNTIIENTNILMPFPLGVIGQYNDYGGIANIQNKNISDFLTKYMFTSTSSKKMPNTNIDDLTQTFIIKSEDYFNNTNIDLNNLCSSSTPVYWTFVLKEIAEQFMNVEFDFFNLKEVKSYNDLLNKGIIEDLMNGLEDISLNMKKSPELKELFEISMFSNKFGLWSLFNDQLLRETFFRNNLQLNRELLNLYNNDQKNEIEDLAKNILLIDCIKTSMLYLNNVWLPKSGVGQGWDKGMVNVIKFTNELCLNYINKRVKKC